MSFLQHLESTDIRRICLIKPSALGDVVQTLPLLPVLRERFPQAEVSWVIRTELREILEGHPQLAEIIPFQRRGGTQEWRSLLGKLRSRQFDLVFDLQGLFRTALMCWATKAPLRVGLETAREGSRWACHFLLPDSGPLVPAYLRYWRVAEALECGDCRAESYIPLSPADQQWATVLGRKLGRPFLVVHPGARWETKCWPAEHFAAVSARASRRYGFGVVIAGTGSEGTAAKTLEFYLRRFAPAAAIVNLCGQTSLKQLAALLQRSELLLSNDSGPMHLAAALNQLVVGIFTCTNPLISGPPPSGRTECVTTQLPCRNCYRRHCPLPGSRSRACLEEITVERVWQRLEKLVERNRRNRSAMRAA